MRIGIFGGSFDPVHLGHLIPLWFSQDYLSLNRLILVPGFQTPFKRHYQPMTTAEQRLAMLSLATQHFHTMEICHWELQRKEPVYTIETVEYLQAKYTAQEWFLLIGQDNWAHFLNWRDHERLAHKCQLAVMQRPGAPSPAVSPYPYIAIPSPLIEISGTQVREWRQKGKPWELLVPPAVAQYIHYHHIYQEEDTCPA